MSLLEELSMDVNALKCGIQGPAGSGKTTTGALIAIGLHSYLKLKSPIAFYDSEGGSGFVRQLFDAAGIKLVGKRTQNFKDLAMILRECINGPVEILLIDSITHPWRDVIESWKKRNNRTKIPFHAWGPIKDEWRQGYQIPFMNSDLHIVMCGRQANVFEDIEDDDDGQKEWKVVKTGTRMATEGETAYEPHLLIEMEKQLVGEGGKWARVANVLKDRSFCLDGVSEAFAMPFKQKRPDIQKLVTLNAPFQFVLPHLKQLTIGSAKQPVDTSGSQEIFDNEGQRVATKERRERDLKLADCEEILQKYWAGTAAASRKRRGDVVEGITWAIGMRIRNWKFILEKFDFRQVSLLHGWLVKLTTDERERLGEALRQGYDEKDKAIDGEEDRAVEAVKYLVDDLINADAQAENELPI